MKPVRVSRSAALAVTLLCLALGFAAWWLTRPTAEAGPAWDDLDAARLRLVWPKLDAFDQGDRAILTTLSRTCLLALQPDNTAPTAVVECLRVAATNPSTPRPPGVQSLPSELDRLLAKR